MTEETPAEDGFQVALRRLENGDYLRVVVERDGPRLAVQFCADGAGMVDGWRLDLTAQGLAELVRELVNAQVHVALRDAGHHQQVAASLADAQLRLAELTKDPCP